MKPNNQIAFRIYSGKYIHIKVTSENSVTKDQFSKGKKLCDFWLWCDLYVTCDFVPLNRKQVKISVLATTIFHKNQNQTAGVISLVKCC